MITVDIKHRSFEETLLACEALGGVDLIVTSPPYPDARPGQYGGDASHDFTWPDYQRLGDHVARALKPGGFAAINIDGPVRTLRPEVGSERSLIAFELAIDWARRVGLRYVEHCAYVRDGAPGLFGDRWRSGWEPMHVFQRPGAPGHFDPTGFTLPTENAGAVRQKKRYRSVDGKAADTTGERVVSDRRAITTAERMPPVRMNDHPAPFSPFIADAFVLCYSPPSGLVCDPFVGSGTVALSCARNGRSVIGGDLGARESDGRRWADIAFERAMAIVDPAQRSLFT
jgi:hypothetical protein